MGEWWVRPTPTLCIAFNSIDGDKTISGCMGPAISAVFDRLRNLFFMCFYSNSVSKPHRLRNAWQTLAMCMHIWLPSGILSVHIDENFLSKHQLPKTCKSFIFQFPEKVNTVLYQFYCIVVLWWWVFLRMCSFTKISSIHSDHCIPTRKPVREKIFLRGKSSWEWWITEHRLTHFLNWQLLFYGLPFILVIL